jgi:hypothetical protein
VGGAFRYDVFICHASEDKDEVAKPLAVALIEKDLEVWYDEFSLHIGDRLLQTIDKGLKESRFGAVILSESFFKKKWPVDELNALFALEGPRRKRVLPVWHGVDQKFIAKHSPILAGRKAARTSDGMPVIVEMIVREVQLHRSRWLRETRVFSPGTIVTPKPRKRETDGRFRDLSGGTLDYLTVKKTGDMEDLADCPLFMPGFFIPPEFGKTRQPLRTDALLWKSLSTSDFVQKVKEAMDSICGLTPYLGGSRELFWTVSDQGKALCGNGVESLAKALRAKDTYGMVYAATTGSCLGTNQENAFVAVMSGYCKSRDDSGGVLQDPTMSLFTSVIPTNPGWVHQIMSPFIDEASPPNMLNFELTSAQSREWLPRDDHERGIHPILGILGTVKHEGYTEILGAVTTNEWFSRKSHEIFHDWHRGIEIGRRVYPPDPTWDYEEDWPLSYLDKSIISIKGRASLDDFEKGNIAGFLPPHVRSFEVPISGAGLCILGIEAPILLKHEI